MVSHPLSYLMVDICLLKPRLRNKGDSKMRKSMCAKLHWVCSIYRKRQSFLTKGKELLKEGKKSEAHECFQKCVDISPEIALAFIKVGVASLLYIW